MIDNWTASAALSEILAADVHRGEVVLQHFSGDAVYVGFGETPVVDKGVRISSEFPVIIVNDHRARESVKAICAATETAEGGLVTA